MRTLNLIDFLTEEGIIVEEREMPDIYINIKEMEAFDHRYKADAHANDKNSRAVKGKSKGKLAGLKPEWVGYKILK